MIKGDKIKLVHKMGVFDNIGEICEVTDIQKGGVICFKFGGYHLGCMSYDEYEKYFEKVEIPTKRTWSKWDLPFEMTFSDIRGSKKTINYQSRTNGKKVQVRSGAFKAEATCAKMMFLTLKKDWHLQKSFNCKIHCNQVKSIAKAM